MEAAIYIQNVNGFVLPTRSMTAVRSITTAESITTARSISTTIGTVRTEIQ